MTIKYYTKSTYGVERNYFADPKIAVAFMAITGQKSFEFRQVAYLSVIFGQEIKLERVFEPTN